MQELTKAQQRRFETVSDRVLRKAEATFGRRADDMVLSDTRRGYVIGEACYRELSVLTGGLEFNVRVSVGRKA